MVQVIRTFRPDVIVTRFSGTPRDGHGHHQASALLAKDAFEAAADPARFPDRGRPWKTRRLLWNGFSFSRAQEEELAKMPGGLRVELGAFDPLLGYSYGEVAGISRSQHRSQAMGSAERRGSVTNYLFPVAGEPARRDWLEGIDLSWRRYPGGEAVEQALAEADRAFSLRHPERALPALAAAYDRIAALNHADRLEEAAEALALAAGLWLDVSAGAAEASPGATVRLTMHAVSRLASGVVVERAGILGMPGAPVLVEAALALAPNQAATRTADLRIPDSAAWTQPFWLVRPPRGTLYDTAGEQTGRAEGAPALTAEFVLRVADTRFTIRRPVRHRYVDAARGELARPFVVVPPVSTRIPAPSMLFPDARPRPVTVEARATVAAAEAVLRLRVPEGWRAEPSEVRFTAKEPGEQRAFVFAVTPGAASGELAVEGAHEVMRIEYDHIPPQTLQPRAAARAVRADVRMSARRIGYVMGAGDEVPAALRQMGAEVELLDGAALVHGDLARFDAIVTGVRAWNNRADLRAAHQRLKEYAHGGGTVVVQYNVMDGGPFGRETGALKNLGLLPVRIGRDRVTVEDSPVRLLDPRHPLLTTPNRIEERDFDGWVQERGLYFASEWDPGYEAPLEMSDPGEAPLRGAILAARTGAGLYIITPLSFFRQLPAGVPGAYRLFANLVSGGKPAQ
ncbi:MAG: hypothetical protein IPM24_14575 [Bryobacterales bacterium]|nr:hypothetical protein [Bryobacterales bacterium]